MKAKKARILRTSLFKKKKSCQYQNFLFALLFSSINSTLEAMDGEYDSTLCCGTLERCSFVFSLCTCL